MTLSPEYLSSPSAWRETAAEFIATLCFVLIGAGSVVSVGIFLGSEETVTASTIVVIALAHALAIAVLVSATARISGGHLNPAVTFTAILTKRIGISKGGMYIIAQLSGAIIGALLVSIVAPTGTESGLGSHGLGDGVSTSMGLITEIILTFILVFVIYGTAMDPKGPSHLAPFAIGMAVLICIFAGLPLTGASMNPARTLGPALITGEWLNHWVYWVGPLIGGSIAALVYDKIFLKHGD